MTNAIFKIMSTTEWSDVKNDGVFRGSAVDKKDGYIHFSSADQVAETLAMHFAGQSRLVLLEVDADSLVDKLRWEASRGGQLFPHFYGELSCELVARVFELELTADGLHRLPAELWKK